MSLHNQPASVLTHGGNTDDGIASTLAERQLHHENEMDTLYAGTPEGPGRVRYVPVPPSIEAWLIVGVGSKAEDGSAVIYLDSSGTQGRFRDSGNNFSGANVGNMSQENYPRTDRSPVSSFSKVATAEMINGLYPAVGDYWVEAPDKTYLSHREDFERDFRAVVVGGDNNIPDRHLSFTVNNNVPGRPPVRQSQDQEYPRAVHSTKFPGEQRIVNNRDEHNTHLGDDWADTPLEVVAPERPAYVGRIKTGEPNEFNHPKINPLMEPSVDLNRNPDLVGDEQVPVVVKKGEVE